MKQLSSLMPSAFTTWRRGFRNCLLAAGCLAWAAPTQAQTIFGLGTITGPNFRNAPVGSQGLILINPNSGASSNLAPISITGVMEGQTLVGIDYRPANNLLYALGYNANAAAGVNNAQLYILDPGTSSVTAVGGPIRLELGGPSERVGFDFNPTVDRIRVTSTNNANVRLNPNNGLQVDRDSNAGNGVQADGNLNYAAPNAALDPGIGAVAYTNSFVGPTPPTTTLYDFDIRNNGLLSIQSPPNDGELTVQNTVMFVITGGSSPGTYGIGQPDAIGFDIYFNPNTNQNVGYLTEVTAPRTNGSRASNTYRLDLATGRATQLGNTVPASTLFNFEIRDLAVAIAAVPTLTWNGNVSTDWRTALNWTPNQVPAAPNDVIIPGGRPNQPTISTPQQAHAVTLLTGSLLTIAPTGTLIAGGDFMNNGGVLAGSGDATVILDLNTPQTIGGTSPTTFQNLIIGPGTANLGTSATLSAPAAVRRVLTLFGNLTVTGQNFTLLSDVTGTAMVVNEGGAVVGNATVQRYINVQAGGNSSEGYRHYSSPVASSTVADLATTGFTPLINPEYNSVGNSVTPFPNVFGYEQSRVNTSGNPVPQDFDKGFFSPNSLSDALEVGRGYTVNIDADATLDFVGTLNNGTYTRGGLGRNLTNDPSNASGWHLLGNPYPAPIDWDLVTRTGMDAAVYVNRSTGKYAGTYRSYVAGSGIGGGADQLAVGQGFFVRTTTPSTTGSIEFTNAARLTTYASPLFQRGASAATTPLVRLDLTNDKGQADDLTVYFEEKATAGFDSQYDAYKLQGGGPVLLAAEVGAATLLSVDALPAFTGAEVAVKLRLQAKPGTYTLRAVELLRLPVGINVLLRDAQTGTLTDLSKQSEYTFALAGASAGRFTLLFSAQSALANAPAALSQQVVVFPNPARGEVFIHLPATLARQATDAQLINALGQTVRRATLAGTASAQPLSLRGVAKGVYTLRLETGQGIVTKRLVIE